MPTESQTGDATGLPHDRPRDTVRRIPLTSSGTIALVGLDWEGESRMTIIVDERDADQAVIGIIQRWVRKRYPPGSKAGALRGPF